MNFKWNDGTASILNVQSNKSLQINPPKGNMKAYTIKIVGPNGGLHGEVKVYYDELKTLFEDLLDIK